MESSLSRGVCLGAALAVCAGCAPPAARTFDVVLEEPPLLECVPTFTSANIDLDALYNALVQAPAAWRAAYANGQLRPSGGTLHVVRSDEDGGLSWFEGFQRDPYYQWNGLVFHGDPHDDYVDAANDSSHDADSADPNDLAPNCGELPDVENDLLATIDGPSLDGRVRRVEYTYFSDGNWACAAHVACARNIALTGAEEQ